MATQAKGGHKLPADPCPKGGLIRWKGATCPIKHREADPHFGWLYSIEYRGKDGDGGLTVWCNISQADIVNELLSYAEFSINQTVEVGHFSRIIRKRKWNFQTAEFSYGIEGVSPDRLWWVGQGELIRRIKEFQK